MKIDKLLDGVEIADIIGELPESADDITDDSRKVVKNGLFFCVEGNNKNGYDFLGEAVKNGAVVAVGEKKVEAAICFVVVKDVKKAMSAICSNFYGAPQEKMKIFGVVGTNGKTSVCHILSRIFENAGYKTATIGTLGVSYNGTTEETGLTSLGTLRLYQTLDKLRNAGVTCVFIEVSAHAIDQRRCEGLYFECLIFTNCTEDHLDYFGDMERYSAVKKSVFDKKYCKYAVVNVDDELGRDIMRESDAKVLTYGIDNPADVFAIDVDESDRGISYIINLFDAIYDVRSPLIGECNVYNTLAAAAVAAIEEIKVHKIANALKNLKAVRGRAEFIGEYSGAKIYIDYAHTSDGLKRTLLSFRKICDGKLYCLFGCGGNREKEKRPIMGAISASISDFTVITTDNPRFEDPCAIISEIENGVRRVSKDYITIEDRKEAIKYALSKLRSGDVLVVAGKGAEEYQEAFGVKRRFSDAEVIRDFLAKQTERNNG